MAKDVVNVSCIINSATGTRTERGENTFCPSPSRADQLAQLSILLGFSCISMIVSRFPVVSNENAYYPWIITEIYYSTGCFKLRPGPPNRPHKSVVVCTTGGAYDDSSRRSFGLDIGKHKHTTSVCWDCLFQSSRHLRKVCYACLLAAVCVVSCLPRQTVPYCWQADGFAAFP